MTSVLFILGEGKVGSQESMTSYVTCCPVEEKDVGVAQGWKGEAL